MPNLLTTYMTTHLIVNSSVLIIMCLVLTHHHPHPLLHISTLSPMLSKTALLGSQKVQHGKSGTGATGVSVSRSAFRRLSSQSSCFNAFSRLDIRVDVKIPGGVSAYVIDIRGEKCVELLCLLSHMA
jgi:ChAPs (Chs5p-Arf1p-binding proteins)